MSTEPMSFPQAENTPHEEKVYPEKITKIVDQIATLNLLEVADLNELLKVAIQVEVFLKKVTVPTPVMSALTGSKTKARVKLSPSSAGPRPL